MSPSQTFSISQPTTNLIELVLLNKPTIVATFNMLTAISLSNLQATVMFFEK
jgi:hypothetical protein